MMERGDALLIVLMAAAAVGVYCFTWGKAVGRAEMFRAWRDSQAPPKEPYDQDREGMNPEGTVRIR